MVYDLKVKQSNRLITNNILPILNLRKAVRIIIESLLWLISSFIASFITLDGLIPKDQYLQILFLGILGSIAFFLCNIVFIFSTLSSHFTLCVSPLNNDGGKCFLFLWEFKSNSY